MDLHHHRAETNGVRLHHVTAGSGPAVLRRHGRPGSHRHYLRIIERFADRCRIIAPDLCDCATEAHGGVIEQCGHWVFQERPDLGCDQLDRQLDRFWAGKA